MSLITNPATQEQVLQKLRWPKLASTYRNDKTFKHSRNKFRI